jgi:hypothetical protein
MRKIAITVAATIPAITVVPICRRERLPAPSAFHRGKQPKMKANEVIRTGRNRSFAPVERRLDQWPALLQLSLGELHDEDGVLGREPDEHHQADLPVDVELELAEQRPARAPNTATGTERSTLNGSDQLS